MSSSSNITNHGVSEHFPARLRVLVIDDDQTSLTILYGMLNQCGYEVTTCENAEAALSLLKDKRDDFDIVLTEVHLPDMVGFALIEHITREMDLPVVVVSSDDQEEVMHYALIHGACDYKIKPVHIESLVNIGQHVLPKDD